MITKTQRNEIMERVTTILADAKIVVTDKEFETMDVADFGLSDIYNEGAQIISVLDTPKLAVRVLVLLPYQTEPEHWHEDVGDIPGKEETFRVIKGNLLIYVEGEDTFKMGKIPEKSKEYYQCRKEYFLAEGENLTVPSGVKHWFQAGEEPVVFYSISTTAIDARDPFSNPNIVRTTVITDE